MSDRRRVGHHPSIEGSIDLIKILIIDNTQRQDWAEVLKNTNEALELVGAMRPTCPHCQLLLLPILRQKATALANLRRFDESTQWTREWIVLRDILEAMGLENKE